MPNSQRKSSTAPPLPLALLELVASTRAVQDARLVAEKEECERSERESCVLNAIVRLEGYTRDLYRELEREPTDEECTARLQERIGDLRDALRLGGFVDFWDTVSHPDREHLLTFLRDLPPDAVGAAISSLRETPAGREVFKNLWRAIFFNLSRWWGAYLHPPTIVPVSRFEHDEKPVFSVDDLDLAILWHLAESAPRRCKQEDLAVAIDASRKTVGLRVGRLVDQGYVVRPSGERSGMTITDIGRAALIPNAQGTH